MEMEGKVVLITGGSGADEVASSVDISQVKFGGSIYSKATRKVVRMLLAYGTMCSDWRTVERQNDLPS